jgi:hypothetical protein
MALSTESSFQLHEYETVDQIDRYIFLVDMSFSMVSGPCPQDVDSNILFNRNEPRRTVNAWDPNKLLLPRSGPSNWQNYYSRRSMTDYQQVAAYDCFVDPSKGPSDFPMPFDVAQFQGGEFKQNKTIVGSDYQGYRFQLLRIWVEELLQNLPPERKAAAKVMIVPFTSGAPRDRMLNKTQYQHQFEDLEPRILDSLIKSLEDVHAENVQAATNEMDVHRWRDRSMGASSPAQDLDIIFDVVSGDMAFLASLGLLRKTNYNMYYMSDGVFTSVHEQINTAVKTHWHCSDCEGDSCPNVCREIRSELIKAVGVPEDNEDLFISLKFLKLQQLQRFFGGGRWRSHFVNINRLYAEEVYADTPNLFTLLAHEYKKNNHDFKYWEVVDGQKPLSIQPPINKTNHFSQAGLIILNPNVRVGDDSSLYADSDGDGLLDIDEIRLGTDPLNPRTDGVCLDSMAVHPAYKDRCESFKTVASCDYTLDVDMDGLNECEEILLGTDPYNFDTDGDGIPDFYEWTYGLNPLVDDSQLDSNGDGVSNLNAFLAGLGPNQDYHSVDKSRRVSFTLNESEAVSQVDEFWTNEIQLTISNMPFSSSVKTGTNPSIGDCLMYHTRPLSRQDENACRNFGISSEDSLHHVVERPQTNRGIALMRLRDRNESRRLRWRIMKFDIQTQGSMGGKIDMSQFRHLDSIDEDK